MTTKQCPKCRNKDYRIEEQYTTTYIYQVVNGTVIACGENNDSQDHIKTTCICDACKHKWHPRNFNFTVDE